MRVSILSGSTTLKLKKSIKLASANACKNCISRENSHLLTHTEIHNLAKRALPEDICTYRHAIMLHKLMRINFYFFYTYQSHIVKRKLSQKLIESSVSSPSTPGASSRKYLWNGVQIVLHYLWMAHMNIKKH